MVRLWRLWLGAALGFGAYGAMVILDASAGTLRESYTSTTIWLYLIAFVGFLVIVAWNERRPISTLWFWGIPIVFRLLLLFTEPTLSDDVYRYLWDGHLVTQGVNPYSYAISATELDQYEIVARTLANNPTLSSPYLPAAHMLFALVAFLLPSNPLSMQIVMTGFDIGTAVLLYRLLPMAGLPAKRVVLYLWSPLVIVEIAHGAHIDGYMVFLAVLSVWASVRFDGRGRFLSPVALALATLTRPIPILLAPVLWWRWNWSHRLVFAAILVGLIVPFGFGPSGWGLAEEPSGAGVFGSARVYSQTFRFNALPSAWLERTLGDSPSNLSLAVTGVIAVVGLVVWLGSRTVLGDGPADVRRGLRLMAPMMVAYVLVTPVLHPWYLVLLVALMPFLTPTDDESPLRWLALAPWLYFSAAIVLSYLTYRDPNAFGELNWVRRIEWFPTLGLLVIGVAAAVVAARREPKQQIGLTT